MFGQRPFRFGVSVATAGSRQEWIDKARKIEALGFATLLMPDHFGGCLAWAPALVAAAEATDRLRVGAFVLDNDFRHPALVASEAATVDLLTEGRLELGLGAGWLLEDYTRTGIPFDPPGARVGRLEEAVRIITGLWAGSPLSFTGRHYTIAGLQGYPRPLQQPHPPILIGGGGRRTLGLAARAADIVALAPPARRGGGLDASGIAASRTAQQVEWVRRAAGERIDEIELNVLLQAVEVTDAREPAAERLAGRFGITVDEVLTSPHLLVGTVEQLVEDLRQRRARFGISYVVAFERDIDALAPVIERLAGR